MSRRRGRTLVAIGVSGMLVAGCGDGADDTADVGSAPTAPTATAPTTTAPTTTAPTTGDTGAADGDAAGQGTRIDIVGISEAFDPAAATVAVGDEVTWANTDGITHTTTAQDGSWNSGSLAAGEEFTFAPEEPGSYPYRCTIHPSMTGELVVE